MDKPRILAVIPSRFGSTRFPGKPLTVIAGKTMIRRVFEQTCLAKKIADVIVATDDDRIRNEVLSFGGKVVMTSTTHLNGTERCAEVAEQLGQDFDIILNVQGDEPFIQPEQIDLLAGLFENAEVQIGTLAKPCSDLLLLQQPSIVKVTLNREMQALYFSRSLIPFVRDEAPTSFYKHIGLYGYKRDTLLSIVKLPPSPLERSENLEQLRWLENGYRIAVAITESESISIDTPEDLKRIPENFR